MNNHKPIYAHLTSEDELNAANLLKPRRTFKCTNFSFDCSRCGKLSIRNLCTISFPFVCTRCVTSDSHKTAEYRENYETAMREKYGDNYNDVIKSKREATITDKYGGYRGMYDKCEEKRNATMLSRYGVVTPSNIQGHGEKCAQTKLERYGSKTYNNREKANQTVIDKYGTVDAWRDRIQAKADATKMMRYGTKTYNNREKAASTSLTRYGVKVPIQYKPIGNKAHYKYTFHDIKFDSSYDLAYYIWLSDNHIEFEYNPNIQFEYVFDGKIHYYNPDFKVGDKLIELKGRQFFKDKNVNGPMVNPYNHSLDALYEAKHQCMIANKVEIITDCSDYEQYVAETYGKDYIASFRNKKKSGKNANVLQQD